MELKDIPRMSVRRHMSPGVQRLQKNAPEYIRTIIEKTRAFPQIKSLGDLPAGSIQILEGGNASVVYSLETEKQFAVIRLREDGVDAEEEALAAWAAQGIRVPTVQRKGALRNSGKPPLKYLILDFVFDKKGGRAPTGTQYLEKHPGRTRMIGQLLGRTLARMHRAKSKRTFGEFADTAGSNKAFRSWNSYLLGYVRKHYRYLLYLGISRRLMQALVREIKRMPFSSRGTYVHGDYSLRNVMIPSSKPPTIVVFDPNPIIGDPSWDLAILFNNRDYRRKRHEWEPGEQEYRRAYALEERLLESCWASYRLASREPVRLDQIRVAQLIQTIFLLRIEGGKGYPDKRRKELEMRVRRETLFERFGSLNLRKYKRGGL